MIGAALAMMNGIRENKKAKKKPLPPGGGWSYTSQASLDRMEKERVASARKLRRSHYGRAHTLRASSRPAPTPVMWDEQVGTYISPKHKAAWEAAEMLKRQQSLERYLNY